MVTTEWLGLQLIVPAGVVPVVRLAGIAGCDQVYGPQRPDTPAIVSAVNKNTSAITLTWSQATSLSHRKQSRFPIPRGGAPDLFESQGFDLPDALAGNGQLAPELLQARRILAQPPRLEHTSLALRQHIKG
jgi:hypothetical protein